MNTINATLQLPMGQFKKQLQEQGFISPVLGELEPLCQVPKSTNRQEVFGIILEGDLTLKSEGSSTNYLKGELFFINKVASFEIQAGPQGAKYLFAFKQDKHATQAYDIPSTV